MHNIRLKPGKEEALQRLHPWIFSGALHPADAHPADGAVVRVLDHRGNYLATGHYNKGGIAVRILGYDDPDLQKADFWLQKIKAAWRTRHLAGLLQQPGLTNCFRLIHGEGDGLPGLVVDVYGTTAALQCHSIGMHQQRELIAEAILATSEGRLTAVFDKSREALPETYGRGLDFGFLKGSGEALCTVQENGTSFLIDLLGGQKTGFFLDQRENRDLLGQYAPNRSVLNTFCYTGGFSAYALRAGATKVVSVDVSAKAMELTDKNVALNQPFSGKHESQTADVLKFFKEKTEQFDIVIVDPPAFAKSLDKRHNAVQGYKRLNIAAMEWVKPGGLLFTFSCSQVVDRPLFYNTITAAAIESGRFAKVLHHLSQGPDHPVSIFHPEGHYLKGLVLEVL